MGDIYTNPPQSRNEAILRATIDSTEYTDPPQSRIEDLLLELKEAIEEGGGGGGTTVVPNPEGEATGDLNKVQIGSTIFGVLGELGTAAKKDSTNAVTQDSSDLVESGAVYSALDSKQPKTLATPIMIGGVSRTTVEAALGALEDNKEDTILAATPLVKEYDEVMRQDVLRLTMDDTPTEDSGNPVKSGGVKSAVTATVDLMKDTTGWLGGNEIPFPYTEMGKTASGITFTANADGSVKINGTATSNVVLGLYGSSATFIGESNFLGTQPFVLSKDIMLNENGSGLYIWCYDASNNLLRTLSLGYNELHKTLSLESDVVNIIIGIRIVEGGTYNNVVIKPMICTPEQYALNPAYRPPHGSVEEVKADKSSVISALEDTIGWTGKNLLRFPYSEGTNTRNGITWTVNSDGSITANGTSTADEVFSLYDGNTLPRDIPLTTVGGVSNNLYLYVNGRKNGQWVKTYVEQRGEPKEFTILSTDDVDEIYVRLRINVNQTVDNIVFYPMICRSDVYTLSPSYAPYHESVELSKYNRSEANILGAKNLWEVTIASQSRNGVDFTVYADGSIKVNGTATADTYFSTWADATNKLLTKGKYILNGCPKGGSSSTYALWIRLRAAGTSNPYAYHSDYGNGIPVNIEDGWEGNITIDIKNGQTINNLIFKPMLRLASDTDPTHAPFAMTNRELTEKVTVKSDSITSSFTANGDVANGLKKIGEIVFIDAAYKEVTASQWDVIATIPAGFRPKTPCRILDGFGKKSLVINVNGDIQAAESISNTYVYIHGSWVVS